MSSTTVCRYSRNCRRPDCYFAHPEGRLIEQGGAPNTQHHHDSSPTSGRPHQGGHGAYNGVGGKNPTPCRFDRQCKRPECYFSHPNGRDIDDAYYGGQPPHQQQPRHSSPATNPAAAPSNSNAGDTSPNAALNRSFEQFVATHEAEIDANETMMENLEDSELQDTWIPASRDCSCCKGSFIFVIRSVCSTSVEPPFSPYNSMLSKEPVLTLSLCFFLTITTGYAYGCKDPTCQSLGVCGCIAEAEEESS